MILSRKGTILCFNNCIFNLTLTKRKCLSVSAVTAWFTRLRCVCHACLWFERLYRNYVMNNLFIILFQHAQKHQNDYHFRHTKRVASDLTKVSKITSLRIFMQSVVEGLRSKLRNSIPYQKDFIGHFTAGCCDVIAW